MSWLSTEARRNKAHFGRTAVCRLSALMWLWAQAQTLAFQISRLTDSACPIGRPAPNWSPSMGSPLVSKYYTQGTCKREPWGHQLSLGLHLWVGLFCFFAFGSTCEGCPTPTRVVREVPHKPSFSARHVPAHPSGAIQMSSRTRVSPVSS